MNTLQKIILISIFILGMFFRFYQLGNIPNSLNWDEVSWGYNAYSIATTGQDEYGKFMPLSFKAFGDFKQPMYVYLDAVPTLIWGLTAFAVRFPSALLGTLTILAVFFFVKELFHKDKNCLLFALVVSGLFAISPWSIQFSRVAFEANVGLFFTIVGATLLLRGLQQKRLLFLVIGTVVISLSCYTYHSQKLFTPLLFIGFIFYAKDYFLRFKKHALIILLIFFLSNIFWIIDTRTTARGRSVMFTSQQTQLLATPTKKLISDKAAGDIFGSIIHNRRFIYANIYLNNYLLHFDPNYLFIKGDNPRHHPPGMGNLYLISLPFILAGMILLWKNYQSVALIVFGWFLLAPIASSLTVDTPNASRSMVFLPTWQIFAGVGIVAFSMWFSKKKRLFGAGIIGFLYVISMIYYAHWYFSHTDKEYANDWQYGYREAITSLANVRNTEKKVYFLSSIEQGYVFYLFYNKINPKEYISSGGSERLKQQCFAIENAYFGKCDSQKPTSGDILVSAYDETNPQLAKVKEIHYPNDEVSVRIYRFK